jgi:ribokinase
LRPASSPATSCCTSRRTRCSSTERAPPSTPRSRGRRPWVSVDAASAAPLRAFGVPAFLDWLPRCLLFANLDEATLLAGTTDPPAAAQVLGSRCGEAIVKLGAAGAIWSDGVRTICAESTARPVVDSTGAGDAFAAGVLAARSTGADVADSLRAGNDLAARAVGLAGARPPRQFDE